MKKYTYLLLYTSIFYAAEQEFNTFQSITSASIMSSIKNIDPTVMFQPILDTDDSNFNMSCVHHQEKKDILGVGIFNFLPLKKNFIVESANFKDKKTQLLIDLLRKDFKALQKCCNFNQDESDDFNILETISLQETSLTIDHDKKMVHIQRIESNDSGIYISKSNFLHLIEAWEECFNKKLPHLLLIQSLDKEYQIVPFYEKELMNEYLTNHPIKK